MVDSLVTKLMCEVDRAAMHEEVDVFPWPDVHADPRTPAELAMDVQQFKEAAVVEKTPGTGLVIRIADQVLNRWEPMGLTHLSDAGFPIASPIPVRR